MTDPAAGQTKPGRRLTDEQLAEAMELIKGANSVELKVTVPTGAQRATVQGLPIDPVEAEPRQVYFFDTPNLDLNRAGLVVRARRRAGGAGDSVVKLRPVKPDTLPADLRANPMFNVEVDMLPGGFVCSASFKGTTTGNRIRQAVAGSKPLSKVFSKEQRAFYAEHAPAGIDLDSLTPLGPTFILKLRFGAKIRPNGKRSAQKMVAELWLYPDGSHILELSTKTKPADVLTVADETRAYLTNHGVPLNAVQQTKTKTALEFYAAQLAGAKPAAKPASRARAKPAAKPAAKPRARSTRTASAKPA